MAIVRGRASRCRAGEEDRETKQRETQIKFFPSNAYRMKCGDEEHAADEEGETGDHAQRRAQQEHTPEDQDPPCSRTLRAYLVDQWWSRLDTGRYGC